MKIMKKINEFKINEFKINELKVFKEIFDKLSEYIFDDKKVLIAISGWPDSMFLSVLIYNFFIQNNLDLDNLSFVHCNHKTRKETDNEEKFVKEFFDWLNLNICIYDDSSCHFEPAVLCGEESTTNTIDCHASTSFCSQWQMKKTENNLRQWRYGEFQKIVDQNNIDFVMTGHNLTDRIESSFMNMFRGAGLNGFLSMRFLDTNSLLQNVSIIRPLLDFTKMQIDEFCTQFDIPFVVDQTNLDSKTSLRNKIRLELFPEFQKLSHSDDSFFESMKNIYDELENQNSDIWSFVEIRKSDYWNCDFAFLRDIPLSFVSSQVLLKVLKKFNLSANVSKNTLNELVDFFASAKQWYKYINWVYLFLSHGKIYIIKAKEDFWQKHIEKSLIIDKLWKLQIGKEIVNILDEKFLWLELRYPKEWDKFSSKSWSKYCINNKIPVFWRNFVSVIVYWNNILEYFYFW